MSLGKKKMLSQGGAGAIVPSENFNTVLFTGNGASGRTVTVGFEPALIWQKFRNFNYDHQLMDSVRSNFTELLQSNSSAAENTNSGVITSTSSTGFTTGTSGIVTSAYNMIFWCWYAPTSESISASGSRLASTIKKNVDAGFSIVSYTGSTPNKTVGHGLSSPPELIIVKNRDVSGNGWATQSPYSGGADYHMMLNLTQEAKNNVDWIWNDTEPTSSVFSIGENSISNGNGEKFIAYCFHSVAGYQKVGTYTGNGGAKSITGLGFTPRFVLFKCSSTTGAWIILDSIRGSAVYLTAESSAAEASTWFNFTFDSDGWSVNTNNNNVNGSGQTYIYLAIA